MILREATIQYKSYDPANLKPKSNKRICCSCDICGKEDCHKDFHNKYGRGNNNKEQFIKFMEINK